MLTRLARTGARAPVALAAAVALLGVGPRAEPALPKPGSAGQIAAAVASATHIERLPNDLVPNLYDIVNDDAGTYYPGSGKGCSGTSKCVYGDVHAKRSIVLFGDSHAYMWLPAIVPYALSQKLKVVLLWSPGCPAAGVTILDPATDKPDTACTAYRRSSITQIAKLDPLLVLLASRTTMVSGPTGKPISQATWQAGLEHTILAVQTKTTKVAVIGDITQFSTILPDCLAANANQVQQCSTPDPNPKVPDHFAAEKAAAKAEHVTYINPHPWLCTSTCSPIVGVYAAYYNNNHVTATYAAYLSGVFGSDLRTILK